MKRRLALLWLLPESPLPPSVGARLRALSLLSASAPHYDITAFVMAGPLPAPDERLQGIDWHSSRLPSRGEQVAALPQLLKFGAPPYLRFFCAPAQRRAVAALLRQRLFDAVVTQLPYCSMAVQRPWRLPMIVIAHNVEWETWRYKGAEAHGAERLVAPIDRHLMRQWELRTLSMARAVAFVSERDRDLVRHRLPARVLDGVVPNTLDLDRYPPLPAPESHAEVLFVGTLGYGPNVTAARFISRELAPLLACEGMTALISGGAGPSGPGVRFLGRPDDLGPEYRRCFASIVPLFGGSGTRWKVLESMAYMRPVVATAKAVEGLAVADAEHYLRAETAAEFTDQLRRLGDPVVWQGLVERGRRLVETSYTWPVARGAWLELLERALGAGTGGYDRGRPSSRSPDQPSDS